MPSLPRALRVLALLAALPLAPLLPSAGAAPLNQPDQPSRRYLVELTEAPLATYDGRLPGLPATAWPRRAASLPPPSPRPSCR